MQNKPFSIAGTHVLPGEHKVIHLPSADLYTQTEMGVPIHVFHGKQPGPCLFITSAIHGDELNSIEIVRRIHKHKSLKSLKGTLITIPVVNVYGFILQSRYLPDRRDLNRSFPGSQKGSLAARLASTLLNEIIKKCDYGIDLHTGALGRVNLPQLRVHLGSPRVKKLALAFDAPVIVDAQIRDGSLREAATELNIPIIVYEGGEALRFNELCIRMGVRGILNVMHYLKMTTISRVKKESHLKPLITRSTHWLRAPVSGMLQPLRDFRASFIVKKNDLLAYIHDPFQMNPCQPIKSPKNGVIIGITNLPVVNEGDAIFNIASTKRLNHMSEYLDDLKEEITQDD